MRRHTKEILRIHSLSQVTGTTPWIHHTRVKVASAADTDTWEAVQHLKNPLKVKFQRLPSPSSESAKPCSGHPWKLVSLYMVEDRGVPHEGLSTPLFSATFWSSVSCPRAPTPLLALPFLGSLLPDRRARNFDRNPDPQPGLATPRGPLLARAESWDRARRAVAAPAVRLLGGRCP